MIIIHKNPNGDTRTAPKNVSYKDFMKANYWHQLDVHRVMGEVSNMISSRGKNHDYTKTEEKTKEMFYKDFIYSMENGNDFTESDWYKLHIEKERHHLLSRCPEDVNLIDVLEMVVDCVCAGMARSGYVRELEINSDILDMAVKNTANMIKDMICLRD